jgi:hypothetical protein
LNYTTSEAGNPFVDGWYAEPGSAVYDGVFWVYPTTSRDAEEQTHIDAFSSPDLINWTKHANVLTTENVGWATKALRAPTPVKRNGRYYLYFSANVDLREEGKGDDEVKGGIGVAVADKPEGPFVDAIGEPLIGGYYNGVRPSDQDVFVDDDDEGKIYIYYGGNSRANVALLNEDMTSLATFEDGNGGTTTTTFKEITPSRNYANGIKMIKRKGAYYLMWSEGDWTGSNYSVAYAMADNPLSPFLNNNEQHQQPDRMSTSTGTGTTILQPDSAVAMGTGHNSIIRVPNEDIWYIIYHRRPLKESNEKNHLILAYDRLLFNDDNGSGGGTITPVTMLVKDNFADGAMLAWATYGGEWAVKGQRLTISYGGSGMALLDTDFSDLVFDADIATTEGKTGHPGLLFRVSELTPVAPGKYKYKGYKAAISPSGVITLGKADMGVFTDLAQTRMRMEVGQEYHVRVVAVGSDIRVFVDDMDVPKIRFVDESFKSGANGVRVFNAAATFGSVSVARPASDATQSRIEGRREMVLGRGREDRSSVSSWDDDVLEKAVTSRDGKEVKTSCAKTSRSSLSLLLCGTDRLFKSDRITRP